MKGSGKTESECGAGAFGEYVRIENERTVLYPSARRMISGGLTTVGIFLVIFLLSFSETERRRMLTASMNEAVRRRALIGGVVCAGKEF